MNKKKILEAPAMLLRAVAWPGAAIAVYLHTV